MIEEHVFFRVRLRVTPDSVALLLKSAQEQDDSLEQSLTVEDALRTLCVWPASAPVTVGYELLVGTEVTALPEANSYQLVVNARVSDKDGVIAAAKEAYAQSWGDASWVPESLEEALYEIVLASNPNPSPIDLGFEIVDWSPVRS